MNSKHLRFLGYLFFFLGVLIGFTFSVIAIWNNVEATNYFFNGVKHPAFKGLHCPVMIAPSERGVVSVRFRNSAQEEDEFFYRAEISGRSFSGRKVEGQLQVPPHQAKDIQFNVDKQDVDLEFFILVKVTIMPNSVHPTQEATCGIMVLHAPGLSGTQTSTTALFLSLAGVVIGLGIWQRTSLRTDRQRLIPSLGIVILLALLAVSLGWWAIAIAFIVILILLIFISLRFAIQGDLFHV